uniref:THAP-type domain-containing protein n=1 Tax=Cacopsylla melanoneura TaxID=428564 RepID=A0A8D9BV93_9HEMI
MSEPYRYCVVPQCTNTKRTTPDKIFVHVPRDRKIRKRWFVAMRRDKFMSDLSTAYVCEDHFNLEEDIENYLRYKIMGSGPIKVKSGVVPHKFDCQKSRTTAHTKGPRPLSSKRTHIRQIQDVLSNVASTSTFIGKYFVFSV